jgi:hypothetical protein
MKVRRPSRLAFLSFTSLLSLLSFLSCKREIPLQDLAATDTTARVRIFLVELEDGAVPGPEAGCGGSVVPVEVELPVPSRALEGSLESLLNAHDGHQGAGFYNALANSPLRIERIERAGSTARVYLGGYLELGGDCDGSRVLSQLTETVTQFSDVDTAELFLDGKPLRELLAGRG